MGHLTITFLTICHLFTFKSSLPARRPARSLPVRRCGASAPLSQPLTPCPLFPPFPADPLLPQQPLGPRRCQLCPRAAFSPVLQVGSLEGDGPAWASPGWVSLRGLPLRGNIPWIGVPSWMSSSQRLHCGYPPGRSSPLAAPGWVSPCGHPRLSTPCPLGRIPGR